MWALFCADRKEDGRTLRWKNRIIRGEDLRFREFDQACVRFTSVLHSNLSGLRILNGGDWTGNGWKGCNFFGTAFYGIIMEVELYERCTIGNALFSHAQMLEIHARECNYAGSQWEYSGLEDCRFEACNFRKASFTNGKIERTLFQNCIFDGTILEKTVFSGVIFRNCLFRDCRTGRPEGCVFQNCSFEKY